MKRRSFLKGLAAAALTLVPATTLAKTDTSPAKPDPRIFWATKKMEAKQPLSKEIIREAMQKGFEAQKENPPCRELYKDLFMSPEALDDIRHWGVDQVDEVTRKELLEVAQSCPKPNRNDDIIDYRAVAMKGPPVIHGWGYDMEPHKDSACSKHIQSFAVDCEWDDETKKWVKKEEMDCDWDEHGRPVIPISPEVLAQLDEEHTDA